MITPSAYRKIIALLLAIAVPGIACQGCYAYEAAAGANIIWRIAMVLAYPALLLGLVWGLMVLCSSRCRPK